MRATPTVAQLRAFVAIADFQHFRDAAASIGVSQPTLSQALSTLEANLGVQLIERNPRRVLVTPDGQFLLPLARKAIDAVEAFRKAALPDSWLSGPLHMGVIPTIAPYLLPALLPVIGVEAPDLQLHVHEDQTHRLLDALAEGTVDVAVLALPLSDSRIRWEALYDEDFVLAVPPGHVWADRQDVPVGQLRDEELLFLEEGHCLRDQTVDVCLSSGVAHAGEANPRAASLSTIVQLVSAGLGMTFLPDTAVKVETRGAQLGVAHFTDPAPGRRIVLAFRKSSTRLEEFEDLAEIVRRAVAAHLPGARRAAA